MMSNIIFLYEELCKATDGSSESMTHDDAIAQIKYWRDMKVISHPVPSTPKIHSCSYFCERPDCIKVQRDEMRNFIYGKVTL